MIKLSAPTSTAIQERSEKADENPFDGRATPITGFDSPAKIEYDKQIKLENPEPIDELEELRLKIDRLSIKREDQDDSFKEEPCSQTPPSRGIANAVVAACPPSVSRSVDSYGSNTSHSDYATQAKAKAQVQGFTLSSFQTSMFSTDTASYVAWIMKTDISKLVP
ncbi:hypothetical protein FRC07_011924 [Ceratobasidium sp. 392]|nr:hypothetical protein FRC07_011924 [Ceratobasidium sp. 392]